MPGFDQNLIDQILSQTEISELISAVVPLFKKSGDNLFGLCPFHQEKTPSFSVNKRKQIFHCFGCGKGGNAIAWLMAYEHISFPESVRRLAEKAGIKVQRYTPSYDNTLIETLYQIHQFAQDFFFQYLRQKNHPLASIGMSYLFKRGLHPNTIDDSGIGLSPPNWDDFTKIAINEGYSEEHLLLAGLCGKNDRGELYDRFRERIMFPIQNLTGRIVGFGGRILTTKNDTAKYVNSPESPIYRKGELLYGMPWARDSIRKEDTSIVVEGYLDLITLHQGGILNTVATSGTALTSKQAQLLRRFSPKVIIVYDGDSAGQKAALRGSDVLLSEGLDVRICILPDGHDPDTYVKKQGAEKFYLLLSSSKEWLDFQLQNAQENGKLTSPATTILVIRDLVQVIKNIQDLTQQELWIRLLNQKMGISESSIRKELEKVSHHRKFDDTSEREGTHQEINSAKSAFILSFFIRHRIYKDFADNYRFIFQNLNPEFLDNLQLSEMYKSINNYWIEKGVLPDINELRLFAQKIGILEWVDERLTSPLLEKGMEQTLNNELTCLDNAVRAVLRVMLRKKLNEVKLQIAELDNSYDEERHKKLTKEQLELNNLEKKLQNPVLTMSNSENA